MKQHAVKNNVNRTRGFWMGMALGLLVISSMLVATSCTTASYGDKFVQDSQVAEQYRFKIYVGGFQFMPPNAQAEKRISEYMVGKDYKSYEIVNRRYNLVPSYYEFTVKFTK